MEINPRIYDDCYIMLDDCCLKQTIQKFTKSLISKQLTEPEARKICIYDFIISSTTYVVIIQFKMVKGVMTCVCADIFSIHFIRLMALFINIMLIIRMVENFKEFIKALQCKCDYRQHPELKKYYL